MSLLKEIKNNAWIVQCGHFGHFFAPYYFPILQCDTVAYLHISDPLQQHIPISLLLESTSPLRLFAKSDKYPSDWIVLEDFSKDNSKLNKSPFRKILWSYQNARICKSTDHMSKVNSRMFQDRAIRTTFLLSAFSWGTSDRNTWAVNKQRLQRWLRGK